MTRRPVSSSNIASVGWDADEEDPEFGTLEVEFKSNQVYRYRGVREQTYRDFLGADSVGRFFRDSIMGKYPAEKQ